MKLTRSKLLLALLALLPMVASASNVSDWNTSAAGNNATPPNGAPEGMTPSAVNDVIRENMGAVARWYSDVSGGLVTTGTGNAYVLTTNSAHAALADQAVFRFRADRANTGAATLNVDTLGAFAIQTVDGAALSAGMIAAGGVYDVTFDANTTPDRYVLTSPHSITLSGIGNQSIDGVLTTDGITVLDATDSDSIALTHDGADGNFTGVNTTNFNFAGATGDFRLRDGLDLVVYDATNADTATFSHNGTDLDTDFTNTGSWIIDGPTTGVQFNEGVSTRVFLDHVNSRFELRDAYALRVYDAGDTSYVNLSHDATNAILNGVSTNQFRFTNFSDVFLENGADFRVWDSANTGYGEFEHDTTDFNTVFVNTTDWNVSGAITKFGSRVDVESGGLHVLGGFNLRVYDISGSDYAQFVHNGTDLLTSFVNTVDWTVSGLTALDLGSANLLGVGNVQIKLIYD